MSRSAARLAALVFLLNTSLLAAQSLPELFQKAKAQVKGESWSGRDADAGPSRGRVRDAGQRGRAVPARGPDGFLPRRLRSQPRSGREGASGFRDVPQPPAKRLDGSRDVLEKGDRSVRGRGPARGAPGCRRPAFDVSGLPGVQASAQRGRAGGRGLGRRSREVAHDGRGKAALVRARLGLRVAGVRRTSSGSRATRSRAIRTTRSKPASTGESRSRTPTSCRRKAPAAA